jgi:hypothetical protein
VIRFPLRRARGGSGVVCLREPWQAEGAHGARLTPMQCGCNRFLLLPFQSLKVAMRGPISVARSATDEKTSRRCRILSDFEARSTRGLEPVHRLKARENET